MPELDEVQTDIGVSETRVCYNLAVSQFKPKIEDMIEALDRIEARERMSRFRADVVNPSRFYDAICAHEAMKLLMRLVAHKREFARFLDRVEATG